MSELADFVLNTFRQVGGIVEPPAYGIYEVLLPEEVAHRWDVPAYQRLAFADETPAEMDRHRETSLSSAMPIRWWTRLWRRHAPSLYACSLTSTTYGSTSAGCLTLARHELAFPNARISEAARKRRIGGDLPLRALQFQSGADHRRETRAAGLGRDGRAGRIRCPRNDTHRATGAAWMRNWLSGISCPRRCAGCRGQDTKMGC